MKKASLEALTYGGDLAKQTGTTAEAMVFGTVAEDLTALGRYGISKVHHVSSAALDHFDAGYLQTLLKVVEETKATVVVFSHNQTGKGGCTRSCCCG